MHVEGVPSSEGFRAVLARVLETVGEVNILHVFSHVAPVLC